MNKKHFLYLLTIFIAIFFIPTVYAVEKTTGRVAATNGLKLREGPTTASNKIITIPHNTRVTITSYSEIDKSSGCDDKWAEIIYDGNSTSYKGYVCSTYLADIETTTTEEPVPPKEDKPTEENPSDNKDDDKEEPKDPSKKEMKDLTDEEFDAYLTSQGFPESYKIKLKELHKIHPNWIFKGVKTRVNWNNAMQEQLPIGKNLLNVNQSRKDQGYEGLLSTESGNYDFETDTFQPHDGLYWYQAHRKTIEYYMDPRNFLNEKYIFMFENLLYDPEYQTEDVVRKILYTDFMGQFVPHFMKGAETYQTSPIFFSSLSRQEVGLYDTNIVTNGKAGVLSDGVDYTGYYNFFNYGASSSKDPKLKSLQQAKAFKWNTQETAILEGMYLISKNYILCGQYTSYFQRFNVSPTATKGVWHQYDTSVISRTSAASITYSSYVNANVLNNSFVFTIPIFDSLPESTSRPNMGNPNNWLKELKVNGNMVTHFYGGTTEYTVTVPYTESVIIDATSVNGKPKVEGAGTFKLENDKSDFKINVTAQNGDLKTYTITIIRDKKEKPDEPEIVITHDDVLKSSTYKYNDNYLWNIPMTTDVNTVIENLTKKYKTVSVNIKNKNNETKNTGTIVTGDKVTISINGSEKTLEVVIYGDTNGDGTISLSDLLAVQKHLLGQTTLLNPYYRAADVNKDSKVTINDILVMQKHLLGYTNISQG